MHDFFIAYATPDRQQAEKLCWFLQDDGCKVFLDVQALRPGASWGPVLREALKASRVIVVLVSTHADDAFYQQEEIGRAIQLARDMPQPPTVIPVLLEKLPQGAVSMPYGVSSLHALDATKPGDLKRVAAELVAWLKESQLNPKQRKVADAVIEAVNNFVGTTIILIRHADSTSSNNSEPSLNVKGCARAQTLIHILGKSGIEAIYHSDTIRSKETAAPLVAHLPSIAKKQIVKAPEIQNNILANHAGKAVLVIGHSNTVPDLIYLLSGVRMPPINDSEFDNLFIVKVLGPGQASVTSLKYGKPTP